LINLESEIHTTELLVPKPSFNGVQTVTEKLEHFKSLDTDLIPAELFQAGSRTCIQVYKLIVSMWNEWKKKNQLLSLFTT